MEYKTIILKFFKKDNNILTSITDIEGEPSSLIHLTTKEKLYKEEIKQLMIKNELMNETEDILINDVNINNVFVENNMTINITIIKHGEYKNSNSNNTKISCNFSKNIIILILLSVFLLPVLLIVFAGSKLFNLIILWLISLIGFIFFIISIYYYETTREIENDNIRLKEINDMKSIFLANMSHELKTPLSNIIGLTELLLTKTDTIIIEEEYTFMKDIKLSAESIYKLINDILIFSKSIGGHIQLEYIDFDLDKLLFDIFSLLTIKIKEKNMKIKINNKNIKEYYFPHLLKGDPSKMKHIILNLLTNAIKFSHENKKIDIVIDFKLVPPENRKLNLTISIIDEGIGIEENKIDKIFIPFQQADISTTRVYGGTGLGLSICNQLVNQMNGNLKVQSKFNEGSKFSINIPFTISKNIKENVNILESINDKKINLYNYSNLINNKIEKEEEVKEKKEEIIIKKSSLIIIKEKLKELQHINILVATDKVTNNLMKIFLRFPNFTINIIEEGTEYKNIHLLFVNIKYKYLYKKLIKNNKNIKMILFLKTKDKNNIPEMEDLIINMPINPLNLYSNIYKLLSSE
jgi:signal transduction histidine kinase